MKTLAVTVAPWSALRGLAGKRITKTVLKKELSAQSDYEFCTIGGFNARGGQTLTIREAIAEGVDMLEVRSDDHVNLIAAIYLTSGKVSVQ